jgi:hypothetical protein
MQHFDDFKQDLESVCLSSLEESERSQTFEYCVNAIIGRIESRFPRWKVVPDVDKLEIHLFYMGNSTVTILYEIIILAADGSYSFVFKEKHRTLDLGDVIPQTVQDKNQ